MIHVAKRARCHSVRIIPATPVVSIFFLVVVAVLLSHLGAHESPDSVERRVWAMGTRLSITVQAVDRDTAVAASEAVIHAVDEVEKRLSTWVDDSELSRLNDADPGSASKISPELEADLRLAIHWWRETEGAFDPGVASLVEAWDLRGPGRQPSVAELAMARETAGLVHLDLDPGVVRVRSAGFGIEEGGFGKGIALCHASKAAMKSGADCVVLDFGGQIVIEGPCMEVEVGIANSDRRDERIALLSLRSGSVSTSGNSERGLLVDGLLRGHLLDPRTGLPAPDWGSVTVVAPDPVAADCLSTALYIMGPKAGGEWLREWPEIEAVFVERNGKDTKMTVTPGLKGRLKAPAGKLTYLQQEIRSETMQ